MQEGRAASESGARRELVGGAKRLAFVFREKQESRESWLENSGSIPWAWTLFPAWKQAISSNYSADDSFLEKCICACRRVIFLHRGRKMQPIAARRLHDCHTVSITLVLSIVINYLFMYHTQTQPKGEHETIFFSFEYETAEEPVRVRLCTTSH